MVMSSDSRLSGQGFVTIMEVADEEEDDEEAAQDEKNMDPDKLEQFLQANADVIKVLLGGISWCGKVSGVCVCVGRDLRTIPVMETNNKGIWPVSVLEKTMVELLGVDAGPQAHAMSLALKGYIQRVVQMTKKSRKAKRQWMQVLKDILSFCVHVSWAGC